MAGRTAWWLTGIGLVAGLAITWVVGAAPPALSHSVPGPLLIGVSLIGDALIAWGVVFVAFETAKWWRERHAPQG
jgi:hypothetical protein